MDVASDSGPPSGGAAHVRLNLLLVSRSANWARAVRSAAKEIGGSGISTCGARDALTRLAGISPHYSHLLVDKKDADGLLKELADLANEIADPSTDMLMLGMAESGWPHIPTIKAANTSAVREALMTTPPRNRSEMTFGAIELRAALDGAMIETRYQPIIRMSDRRPIGLEALARLNHPVAGTMLPDQFLPQIEKAGLAAQMTELVSTRVLADLTSPALNRTGLRMSVNFPLDVMLMPAALDRMEEQRAATGIPARRIIIELTESRPVEDLVTLRRSLDHLRDLGYGVAIDDVGPAVPRLAPLLELPFTSLKLDKDQVRQVIDSSEVRDFLAQTIIDATELLDGDVVVVTQKIVSKAEGQMVPIDPDDPEAKRALVEQESVRVLRRRGELIISETRHGFICANAGVDLSNVPDGQAALLPVDADRSARRLMERIGALTGASVAIVISDTFGRPWRRGVVDVAIGCAGVAAVVDLRGTPDALGRELVATEMCIADEIASAAELVMGKAAGVPVAVIRGVEPSWLREASVHDEIIRPPEEDLFR